MATMRQSRAPRVARGVAAASVATFVALLSHVAGGGAMPGWLGIAVPWVLSVFVSTLLTGRRLSLIRLSLSVALSQVLFHTLFVLGAADAGAATAGHHHGVAALSPLSAEATAALYADAAMWGWHVFAGVVTVAAIHRGERIVAAMRTLAGELVDWLRRRLPASVLSPLPDAPRAPVSAVTAWSVEDAPRLAPLRRRGPPALRVL